MTLTCGIYLSDLGHQHCVTSLTNQPSQTEPSPQCDKAVLYWTVAFCCAHHLSFALCTICFRQHVSALHAGLTKVPIDGQPKSIVKDLEDMARTYIKVSQHTDVHCSRTSGQKQACSLGMLLPTRLVYQQLFCATLLWVIAISVAHAAVAVLHHVRAINKLLQQAFSKSIPAGSTCMPGAG